MLQIQSGIDPSAGPEETGITLEQILERYLEARQLSPFTVDDYQYHVDFYLAKWKNRAVADITRADVRTRLHEMKEKHGNTTAHSVMRTLRALINEAKRLDDSITANPVEVLRIPQNNRRQVDNLDLGAWWQSAQAISPMRRDLHIFFLFTGLRKTSTLTIRRRDVDLEKAVIAVQHMKSGRPFILPLSDFLVDMLRARMENDVPLDSEWLWPSISSKDGHVTTPYEDNLPSPHVYRHLWRTHAIAAGVPYAESALLLDQRLPGASGGYVHAEHLAEHLRQYQQKVTDRLVTLTGMKGQPHESEAA
ncbi:MAG: tyrosine-type recombinase/integrase [Alphaproteobacteria bacterium]